MNQTTHNNPLVVPFGKDSTVDPGASTTPEHKATLNGAGLRTPQRVHAAAIFLLPLVGTVAAVALALENGVGVLEAGLLVVMYLLTLNGITVGFHRYLTHRAFQAGPVVKSVLVVLGSMAFQGPPIYWASNHRRHHLYSDAPGDPHSPFFDGDRPMAGLRGLWHAHAGWSYTHDLTNAVVFSKDLLRDRLLGRLNRLYYAWALLGLAVPTAIGGLYYGTWAGALSGLLWGGAVRLFLSYHATNSINSITHRFGSRPFNTREHSRNNVWLIFPTGGEAWHNNHHAFPQSAIFGLGRWQIDPGGVTVRMLEKLRLVWDVKKPTAEMIAARKAQLQQRTPATSTGTAATEILQSEVQPWPPK